MKTNVELKLTPAGQHYWDNKGAMQTEFDSLYEKLVPSSGNAASLNGELIRAISRLHYEYYNNGNCNAYVRPRKVSKFYGRFIDLIERSVPDAAEAMDGVRVVITSNLYSKKNQFCDMYSLPYDRMMDIVTHYVANNRDNDQPIPAWYEKD